MTTTTPAPYVPDLHHSGQAARVDGTARYGFHASREHSGQYVIYPRTRRELAQVYKPWMIARGGLKVGPTFANASEIDALGGALFGR